MAKHIVSEAVAHYGPVLIEEILDEPWVLEKTWTEEEYLALETNRLVEFVDGKLEILPMPDYQHNTAARKLANLFEEYAETHKPGVAVCAPFIMKVRGRKYREPDVIFLFNENLDKFDNKFWTGADIAVEIVSPGGEKRDWHDKRADYARAGISEYWIIDPKPATVTVLKLVGKRYVEHGVFPSGERVTSSILIAFSVEADLLLSPRMPKRK